MLETPNIFLPLLFKIPNITTLGTKISNLPTSLAFLQLQSPQCKHIVYTSICLHMRILFYHFYPSNGVKKWMLNNVRTEKWTGIAITMENGLKLTDYILLLVCSASYTTAKIFIVQLILLFSIWLFFCLLLLIIFQLSGNQSNLT